MNLFVVISKAAEFDLEDIFDYTYTEHGIDQAVKYVSDFDVVFENLARHPNLGRDRSEIREGLRSFLHKHHIVFYRIMMDKIRIVRILHEARDLPRQFKDILVDS